MSEPNGTYPQLAQSFYNGQQMTPYSNGRQSPQVPTQAGNLQNMAQSAYNNYAMPALPSDVNAVRYRASNVGSYYAANAGITSNYSTALNVGSVLTGIAAPFMGAIGATIATPLSLGLGAAAMIEERAAKTHGRIRYLQTTFGNMNMTGSSMADPITGRISLTGSRDLANSISAGNQGRFQDEDLRGVMEYASKSGMLTGHNRSAGQLSNRILELAKITKEIVDVGEGITAADAMNLQIVGNKLGMSSTEFSRKQVGKKIALAAKVTGMTAQDVIGAMEQGGSAYASAGLSGAQGMLSQALAMNAAASLAGSGNISGKTLAALGGQEGLQQALFKAGATSMNNVAETLAMGAMKLSSSGEMYIDKGLLDRALKGEVSMSDMSNRFKREMLALDLMPEADSKKLKAQIARMLPDLVKDVSANMTAEQQMTMAGARILEMSKSTGDIESAIHEFFGGDAAQATAFKEYARNRHVIAQEEARQDMLDRRSSVIKNSNLGQTTMFDYRTTDFGFMKSMSEGYDILTSKLGGIGDAIANRRLDIEERERLAELGHLNGIQTDSLLSRSEQILQTTFDRREAEAFKRRTKGKAIAGTGVSKAANQSYARVAGNTLGTDLFQSVGYTDEFSEDLYSNIVGVSDRNSFHDLLTKDTSLSLGYIGSGDLMQDLYETLTGGDSAYGSKVVGKNLDGTNKVVSDFKSAKVVSTVANMGKSYSLMFGGGDMFNLNQVTYDQNVADNFKTTVYRKLEDMITGVGIGEDNNDMTQLSFFQLDGLLARQNPGMSQQQRHKLIRDVLQQAKNSNNLKVKEAANKLEKATAEAASLTRVKSTASTELVDAYSAFSKEFSGLHTANISEDSITKLITHLESNGLDMGRGEKYDLNNLEHVSAFLRASGITGGHSEEQLKAIQAFLMSGSDTNKKKKLIQLKDQNKRLEAQSSKITMDMVRSLNNSVNNNFSKSVEEYYLGKDKNKTIDQVGFDFSGDLLSMLGQDAYNKLGEESRAELGKLFRQQKYEKDPGTQSQTREQLIARASEILASSQKGNKTSGSLTEGDVLARVDTGLTSFTNAMQRLAEAAAQNKGTVDLKLSLAPQ